MTLRSFFFLLKLTSVTALEFLHNPAKNINLKLLNGKGAPVSNVASLSALSTAANRLNGSHNVHYKFLTCSNPSREITSEHEFNALRNDCPVFAKEIPSTELVRQWLLQIPSTRNIESDSVSEITEHISHQLANDYFLKNLKLFGDNNSHGIGVGFTDWDLEISSEEEEVQVQTAYTSTKDNHSVAETEIVFDSIKRRLLEPVLENNEVKITLMDEDLIPLRYLSYSGGFGEISGRELQHMGLSVSRPISISDVELSESEDMIDPELQQITLQPLRELARKAGETLTENCRWSTTIMFESEKEESVNTRKMKIILSPMQTFGQNCKCQKTEPEIYIEIEKK